jgi:hypothetical protein
MKRGLLVFIVIMTVLLAVVPMVAKGPVDKITVRGHGLKSTIEMADPAILEAFNPWMAQFIDWQQGTSAAPRTGQVYDVAFVINDTSIYNVQFVPGVLGEQGYIYLPGPGDPSYNLNIGTIIQDGNDGEWHRATSSWDNAIQPLITQQSALVLPATGTHAPSFRWLLVIGGGLTIMGSLAHGVRKRMVNNL